MSDDPHRTDLPVTLADSASALIEAAEQGLKPVPAEHEEAWAKIQQRESPQMQRALYLVAIESMSPRRACTTAGFASGSNPYVYDKAKHYGLFKPQRDQMDAQSREISVIYGDILIDRAMQQGDELTMAELNFAYGTATDKVIKREQTSRSDTNPYGSSLDQILATTLEQGGSFSLTVSGPARPDHDEPETITVEPVQTREEP